MATHTPTSSGDRDVDVRQLARAEPEEEEGVARGLAGDEAPDHQEQYAKSSTPRSSSAGRIPSSRVARRGTGAQKPRGWRMKRAVYPIPGGRRTRGADAALGVWRWALPALVPSVLSRGCADAGARALRGPHQVEPRCKMRQSAPHPLGVPRPRRGRDGDRHRKE